MTSFIKIIYSILFCLLINNGFAQKNYTFDKQVKYKFSTKYTEREYTGLFNSEDDSYSMDIFYRNDTLISTLHDRQTLKRHYFLVKKSNLEDILYLKTEDLAPITNNLEFQFSEMNEKKGTKEIQFKILNNKKRNIAKYKLIVEETNNSMFHIFQLSTLETLFYTQIIPPINFLVLESNGKNISGNYVKYKLDSISDINFNIRIPN